MVEVFHSAPSPKRYLSLYLAFSEPSEYSSFKTHSMSGVTPRIWYFAIRDV